MILGVGIDLVEVPRLQAMHEQHGERLLKRFLRPEEIAYCLSHKFPAPQLAARFAVKEAVAKAFGTGIGAQLNWLDMEVRHQETGQPFLVLHGGGKALLESRGARTVHISISHTNSHATAVAVLES
jgi:holo-[acyl-carrier protein] synthase